MTTYIQVLLDSHGQTVTIRDVSKTYNERGDATETYTDYSGTVFITTVTEREELEKFGAIVGELIKGYADPDASYASYLTEGNIIVWNDENYRIITSNTTSAVIGNEKHIEFVAKKE